MLISILIGFIFLFQPLLGVIYMSSKNSIPIDYVYIFYVPHASGVFDLFAPALAVLPAATLFCDEYNSGFLKSILMRTDKKKYIIERIICNSISGGFALAIPILLIFVVSLVFGEPYLKSNIPENFSTFYEGTVFENIQFIWGGLFVSVITIVLTFIFGMVWANAGLCISAFVTNKYVSLAFPIILYYCASITLYRFNLIMLSPMNTIMPNADKTPSLSFVFVYQFILWCTGATLFAFGIHRRLKNV